MKQVLTRELFAYWDDIRGDRLAPERADVDPIGIRSLLGNAFVLEVDAAGEFPFRLSGTRINALFLRELRGTSFIELWRNNEHVELTWLLRSVLDEATPAVLGATAAPYGHAGVDLELLVLPLRHRGKTHARILGSLAPAIQSSWFGLVAVEPLTLHSIRILRRGGPVKRTAPRMERVEKLHPSPRAAARPAVSRRAHLTVYSSDR